jgi:elongation factor Ts
MLDNIAKGKLARFFKDKYISKPRLYQDSKLSVANYKETDKDLIVSFKELL